MSSFEEQVERNIKGKDLERSGKIDLAVQLYEENIKEKFAGNWPYNRLAIIYRKRKQKDEEIRALEKSSRVAPNQ